MRRSSGLGKKYRGKFEVLGGGCGLSGFACMASRTGALVDRRQPCQPLFGGLDRGTMGSTMPLKAASCYYVWSHLVRLQEKRLFCEIF
jgi:hypothetical protein